MKRISEKKLEAFSVGIMGKRQMSKKEIEEQKKKEDEEAAAHAFQEFVETFQQTPNPSSKVWIKAGTYDAGSRREDYRDKGKIYKPSSKLDDKSSSTDKAEDYAKMLASDLKKDIGPLKKKNQEKKKSNLELFKEELRQIQEEREERHKYKSMMSSSGGSSNFSSNSNNNPTTSSSTSSHNSSEGGGGGRNSSTTEGGGGGGGRPEPPSSSHGGGSFDTGDPNTTNLYLGNLSPKITEQQLMEIFGRYGPLASIKIMWPRSEEEKMRGRNCGFVAYMSRKDAERALRTLNGRYVMSYEMRLGWGKAVPIMNQPIFIPPTLLELTMPPPSSGLPFNAQPPPSEAANVPKKHYKEYTTQEEKDIMKRILRKSVVKVIIPTEKSVLHIIHRTIEFVIREGPLFEAMIMTREVENPMFSFLFDNESPAHIYYRWKLYSLLQGDTPTEWSEKEFRMFKDGPIWKPPIANFYTQGMPDELVVDPEAPEIHKGALSVAQRDRLEDIIHYLTPERSRIGDAMIFCIEHADAADEICECIAESLANPTTLASRKIARLYLISDVLHNCTVKVSNASFFRKSVEGHLVDIFSHLHTFYNSIESRLKAEGFKTRVLNVLRTWNEWAIYSKEFLHQLRLIFLGKQNSPTSSLSSTFPANSGASGDFDNSNNNNPDDLDEDIDGAPLSGDEKDDEDLDGVPLDGAALLKGVLMRALPDKSQPSASSSSRLQQQQPHNITQTSSSSSSSRRQRGAGPESKFPMNPSSMTMVEDYSDDIDGVPMDEDIDGIPIGKFTEQSEEQQQHSNNNNNKNRQTMLSDVGSSSSAALSTNNNNNNKNRTFIPSKWETVDPEQIEAQAITTSKWDTLDTPSTSSSSNLATGKTTTATTTSVKVRNRNTLLLTGSSSSSKSFKYYDNSSGEGDDQEESNNQRREEEEEGEEGVDDDKDKYENEKEKEKDDKKDRNQRSSESPEDDEMNPSDEEKYNYNKTKRKQIKRDIELKVLEYQDALESGQESVKSGWTIPEQLNHYRKRLIKKHLLSSSHHHHHHHQRKSSHSPAGNYNQRHHHHHHRHRNNNTDDDNSKHHYRNSPRSCSSSSPFCTHSTSSSHSSSGGGGGGRRRRSPSSSGAGGGGGEGSSSSFGRDQKSPPNKSQSPTNNLKYHRSKRPRSPSGSRSSPADQRSLYSKTMVLHRNLSPSSQMEENQGDSSSQYRLSQRLSPSTSSSSSSSLRGGGGGYGRHQHHHHHHSQYPDTERSRNKHKY